MDLLGGLGWVLKREKPAGFKWTKSRENWEGLTDGGQHWMNPSLWIKSCSANTYGHSVLRRRHAEQNFG